MRIEILRCDRCNCTLTHTDTDGDDINSGIFSQGEIEFKVNQRTSTGSSGWYVTSLTGGDYCSFECFEESLQDTLDDLRRFRKWEGR